MNNLTLNICPILQVLSYYYIEVNVLDLTTCSISIEQKMCEEKTLQPQSLSNAMRCFDQRFAVENFWASCLIKIFDLSHPKVKIQHAKIWFMKKIGSSLWDTMIHILFLSTWHTDLWLKGCLVKVQKGYMSSIPAGAKTLCSHLAIFFVTEPVSGLTHMLLYCTSDHHLLQQLIHAHTSFIIFSKKTHILLLGLWHVDGLKMVKHKGWEATIVGSKVW